MHRKLISHDDRVDQTFKGLLTQLISLRRLQRCLLFAVIPGIVCYALLLVVLTAAGFSVIEAIRDSVQQTETSSWLGLVSNLGVLLTVSTAVICLFTVSITSSSVKKNTVIKKQRECLFLIGLLSAFLATDDFFLLHDRHVGEHFIYVTYAFCLTALLIRHFSRIVEIDGPAFIIAGGLLALSLFTDVIQGHLPFSYEQVQLFEEGFKFVGMATWLYFSYRMASTYVTTYAKLDTKH